MKKAAICLLLNFYFFVFSFSLNAQTDTSLTLEEVIIKAYEQNRILEKIPAAINQINRIRLERFSNTNILPALNSTPGVRMEERSPGSYRMNIRGSTLRSPFGTRNIKIYWDGIPFTDPGGNTYLNQLSFFNFHSIEIIKGPAGSLYGAGTGGALLISSRPEKLVPGFFLHGLYGSFDLGSINFQMNETKGKLKNTIDLSHLQSHGYRDHTAMRRDVATWQTQIVAGKKENLKWSFLYGDLFYETPGALTKTEYQNNPRAARPAAGVLPSADGAKAAIFQKTWLGGLNNHYRFSDRWENTLVFYGAYSTIKNPTFRNYEARKEPHFGGRTFFTWKPAAKNNSVQLVFGAEAQKGFFNTRTYKNVNGHAGEIITNDNIRNSIWSIFGQTDFRLKNDLNITGGISINKSAIKIKRLSSPSLPIQKRSYKNEAAPRVAVSKRLFSNFYLYGSIAKGFSPPTVAEVLPSTSVISTALNAEQGINYETGIKSNWLNRRLYIELNAFYYMLKNAIVQRRDANNADYFLNAGSTKQQGIESQASYLVSKQNSLFSDSRIWISHTWNDFIYKDFKQLDNDFSGNQLPSVASHTLSAGMDIIIMNNLYTNLTYYYSDRIPLNDANTEYASSFNLFGGRLGWRKNVNKKLKLDIFAGIDNAFNVTYSLGNDINAAGGRYFNAASGRNYYIGITTGLF